MILFKKSTDLQAYIKGLKAQNAKIGFVPTMGALHSGHLSLIKIAQEKCDIVVCSIFVNPTQFNQATDLATYPRPIENDIRLLAEAGCTVLFHPEVEDVYGNELNKVSTDHYGNFIHVLEGASRPGHFDGVVTIVGKLFRLVEPNQVFFGQKDFQQCMVVNALIEREFKGIEFNLCPIAREEDGLAMSSRNVRLTAEERKLAPEIFACLSMIRKKWNEQSWEQALLDAREKLSAAPFRLEYLQVCRRESLEELHSFEPQAVVLVALQLGKTRLIDNLLLDVEDGKVANEK